MAGCCEWLKADGDALYAADINDAYEQVELKEDVLELYMDITALQFCQSLTPVSHDYVLIDAMTDSGGYNNTVCTTDTTSTYFSTGLTGHYLNSVTCTICPTQVSCGVTGSGVATCGCFFANTCYTEFHNRTACMGVCGSAYPTITGKIEFGFCINLCFCGQHYNDPASTACNHAEVLCSHDNFTIDRNATQNGGTYCCQVIRCYCYVCTGANCYDFYCNGACKCAVTMSAYPCITLCSCVLAGATGAMSVISNASLEGEYSITCTKIATGKVCWASPIKSVYLSKVNAGTGTIVYNIKNAATAATICTGLLPNCTYYMTTCVCCHYYEIIQCADNKSCLTKYAVAVGV